MNIVVKPIQSQFFIGGAGIVALHAASLNAKSKFFGVIGCDSVGEFAKKTLKSSKAEISLVEDYSRPTTLKQRYRIKGRPVFRVSNLSECSISEDISNKIYQRVLSNLSDADLVIFSDFNYGCLPLKLVKKIITQCKKRDIPMVADSQVSSQKGDLNKYRDMLLLTPTEYEARVSIQDFESGIINVAEKIKIELRSKNLIITLGEDGVLINSSDFKSNFMISDRLPALNMHPKDISGGGDSFMITSALSLVSGATLWEAGLIGSIAAACQVSRVGNIPLEPEDLFKALI